MTDRWAAPLEQERRVAPRRLAARAAQRARRADEAGEHASWRGCGSTSSVECFTYTSSWVWRRRWSGGCERVRELPGRFAPSERFGFVDRGRWDSKRRRRCLREMTGKHAGRYVAKYPSSAGTTAAMQVSETVTHDDVPPLVVYVARSLTSVTGLTMRALRADRLNVVLGRMLELDAGDLAQLLESGVDLSRLQPTRGP